MSGLLDQLHKFIRRPTSHHPWCTQRVPQGTRDQSHAQQTRRSQIRE